MRMLHSIEKKCPLIHQLLKARTIDTLKVKLDKG